MDPKKTALVAKAFREANIDAQDVPETVGLIVCAFAREVAKVSDPRDADTLIFMTIDQVLTRWQSMRSVEAPTECMQCLGESNHVPADVWVVARNGLGENVERFASCDPHAGPTRDYLISLGKTVHIERIRR